MTHAGKPRRKPAPTLDAESAAMKLQIKLEDLVSGDPTAGGGEQRHEVKKAAEARESMGKKSLATHVYTTLGSITNSLPTLVLR